MKWKLAIFLLLIVATAWILIGRSNKQMHENTGSIFGTVYHIKYEHTADLHDEILKALNEVDTTFSLFKPQGELSRFNRGEQVDFSLEFLGLTQMALKIAKETDGAFDPTVAPLVNAWGFGFKKGELPTAKQVDSLLALVGYEKVSITDKKVKVARPNVQLDFGAIAKGYGVDRVAKVLADAGVLNYMVEIGGEIAVRGRKPDGEEWRIGVAKPIEGNGQGEDVQAVITLTDGAMATSGNYRNFYIKNGKKYAHTVDPRTGYPVEHDLLSATVIAPTCSEADAYATAFMVMGKDKAKALLARHKELKAYFVYTNEKGELATWHSERFPQILQ